MNEKDNLLLEKFKITLSEYHDVFETDLLEERKNIQMERNLFDDLRKLKGFEGAGFYNSEGDLIIARNPNLKSIREFGFLGLNLNKAGNGGIERIRLGRFESFQIHTDKRTCIFSWLIPENIFLEVVIGSEGDAAALKGYIEKMSLSINNYLYDN